MASFLCAVHAPDQTPLAFALVEQTDGPAGPTYAVRDLRALGGDDPTAELLRVTASEPQYAGAVRFVTTGGQASADALHARGPSAVAVSLAGERSTATSATSVQALVDTFERLYRDGCVDVPGTLDAAGPAVEALYRGADLDDAAADSDYDAEGTLDAEADDETSVDPARIADPANQTAEAALEPVARVATGTGAPDLGEHEGVAVALALAVWFGETLRDGVPATDVADEALAEAARNTEAATDR